MEIIAIANHKGGCGKTTTAINLAYSLSLINKKVLLVDMDPQGHSTLGLNIDPDRLEKTNFDLLTPNAKTMVNKVKLNIYKNLDLLPANMMLAFLEQLLAGKKQREFRLKKVLSKVKNNYDFIIIDTAPSLGLLTINALLAANKVIITLEPSNYALHGLSKIEETLEMITQKAKHKIKIRYLLTLFNKNSKFSYDFFETVKWSLCDGLFMTKITLCDIYKDAATLGLPVYKYRPEYSEAEDYRNLTTEVIAWCSNKSPLFISSLPEVNKQNYPFHDPAEKTAADGKIKIVDIFELKKQTQKEYKYKYVVDTNGNVSSFKLNTNEILENVLN